MQAIYKRTSVLAGFLVLVSALVLNAWYINRQLDAQVKDHDRLIRIQQILLELTQTGLLLDDAETGQRGFLYTGNAAYLEPYNLAEAQVDLHLQALTNLTAGYPRQRANVDRLSQLIHAKLSELHETISLYSAGKPQQARELVLSDQGKLLMDQVRKSIKDMEQDETARQAKRAAEYERSVWVTRSSILLSAVLAVLGTSLLAYYILREMALRERHTAEMRAGEEWYRVTLTSIGDAVIATDAHGLVTFLNPVAEELTGHDAALAKGKPIAEIFPIFNEYTQERVENPVEKVMEHGRVVGLANHTVLQHRAGRLTPIEDSAAPIRDDHERLIGVVLAFRDATLGREAEEILRKAEKLAAAARLAATVAHEINNPLEAVGNLVFLAKSSSEATPELVEFLTLAEDQLERVAHITKQTLAFYRESRKWEPVDMAALLDSALKLYANKLQTRHIVVEKDYRECPPVLGSEGELKQVIGNLISNAADAVSAGGRIRVGLSCAGLSMPDSSIKGSVVLRIEDDGPGIPVQNLDRIFEPFFTTKEDVGTGLGLWVAKEIVERHGGTIHADSGRPGGLPGAVFTLSLPVDSAAHDVPGGDALGGVARIDD